MKLNKHTGEMKLKGPNHWEWFTSHIDALFDCAPDLTAVKDGGSEMIERALGIQHIAVSITYSHTIKKSLMRSLWVITSPIFLLKN